MYKSLKGKQCALLRCDGKTISGGESAESRKRKSTSPPAPHSSTWHTKEEEVDDIVKEFEEKHGGKYSLP